MKKYDLIIIGGGPAGLSAGIYASRLNIKKTLIIEKNAPGGQLLKTFRVDNLIGMNGKNGAEISKEFYNHVLNFNVEFKFSEVLKIEDIEKKQKIIITSNNEKIETKSIIIASGMKAKKLNLKEYDKFFGNGISTCLICDGPFYKNKEIAVIGGGNSVIKESIFASKIVKKINIINKNEKLKGFDSDIQLLNNIKNIKLFNNSEITKINGKNNIDSIIIKNNKTNLNKKINVNGVFTYIGWESTTKFINENSKILNKNKFIILNFEEGKTKIPGIFAAGDVFDKKYKQITNALSDGTNAALSAKEYLDNLNDK